MRLLGRSLIVAFLAAFVAAEESGRSKTAAEILALFGADDAEHDGEAEDEDDPDKAVYISLKEPPKWGEMDPVIVYYAEFLLSPWVLDHAPWNAYHSGMAFENLKTGEKALFDYCPDDTSSTTKLIFPEIPTDLSNMWNAVKLLLGVAEVNWRNRAHMTLAVGKNYPKQFTNFVKLGNLTGAHFSRFANWVEGQFQGEVFTFDPYEVLVLDSNGNVEDELGSNMCHDFVTNGLWALYRDGVKLKPENMLFRDHIIVYGKTITKIDDMLGNWFYKRSMLRFYRTCLLYLEKIKQQFTFGRETLISVWKLGIPAVVYTQQQYYQVELSPPFLNYCYLSLAIPPEKHNPLTTNKLCALSIDANFTNQTVPVPYGVELGVEEQLDQPEVLLSLILVALGASLPALFKK